MVVAEFLFYLVNSAWQFISSTVDAGYYSEVAIALRTEDKKTELNYPGAVAPKTSVADPDPVGSRPFLTDPEKNTRSGSESLLT